MFISHQRGCAPPRVGDRTSDRRSKRCILGMDCFPEPGGEEERPSALTGPARRRRGVVLTVDWPTVRLYDTVWPGDRRLNILLRGVGPPC